MSLTRSPLPERARRPMASSVRVEVVVLVVAACVGAGIAQAPLVALAAAVLFAACFLPSWLLLTIAVVTVRGYDVLLPRDGLVAWQTISSAAVGIVVIRDLLAGTRRRAIRFGTTEILLVAFAAWLLLTSLPAGHVLTAPLRLLPYVALPVVWQADPRRERLLLSAICHIAVIEVLWSLPQAPDRMIGVHTGDPHQLGFLLLGALAALVGRRAVVPTPRLYMAVIAFGIVATRTRGVWFATAVFLVVAFLPRIRVRRLLLLIVGVSLLGLVAVGPLSRGLGLNEESGDLRRETAIIGTERAFANPLFGTGWTSRDAEALLSEDPTERFRAFNLFIFVASVAGFPAAGLIVAVLVVALVQARRRNRAAYLFIAAFAALSLSEATLYPGAMSTMMLSIYLALATKTPAKVVGRSTQPDDRTLGDDLPFAPVPAPAS